MLFNFSRRLSPNSAQAPSAASATRASGRAPAPAPPPPPQQQQQQQELELALAKEAERKGEIYKELLTALCQKYAPGTLPLNDGRQVFDLIYWFFSNIGREWNEQSLFNKVGTDWFLTFLNCLEKGGVHQLTTEYVENHLRQTQISYQELKRQSDATAFSIYYNIGFGKVPNAVRDKMKQALTNIETRESEGERNNVNFDFTPRAGAPFGSVQEASHFAVGLNSMNGMNTGGPAPAPSAAPAAAFTNSMNGMNTGGPAPAPSAAPAAAFTPHTATATAATLRTPATVSSRQTSAATGVSSAMRPSRLFGGQETTTWSAAHRSHSQFASTNPTPVRTPALPTNREAVENAMTGTRNEELLLQQTLIDLDQDRAGSFAGENKMDGAALLSLRDGFDPTGQGLHRRLAMNKVLARIREKDEALFKDVDREFAKSQGHASQLPFRQRIDNELQIVEDEKHAYLASMTQVDQTVNAVSVSIAQAIENVDHAANEKVAQLNREWEEKERLHKEAELQHDRDVKEVKRKQKEESDTFRYKDGRTIAFGEKLKEKFTKSFDKLKDDNAARLALPLALSRIDKDAYVLVQDAVNIRDPTTYTTAEEEMAFEELETKFFQQLALVETNESALVEQALKKLYG